ncbi:MAG: glutaminyl-peptide cyclotransferase [Gammaproteobacteria bacterium]
MFLSIYFCGFSAGNAAEKGFCDDGPPAEAAAESSSSGQQIGPGRLRYRVIARHPHDRRAFTQGLAFFRESLYESTGLLGESGVRKLNLRAIERTVKNQPTEIYFGEGLAVFNGQLMQMSWKSGKIFLFDPETLEVKNQFRIDREVWGLTVINNRPVISDGTSTLYFLNPETFAVSRSVAVTMQAIEISGLNELEYAGGYIYANVWPSDCIVQINPVDGRVEGWVNLSGLHPKNERATQAAVLNGIAYDQRTKHFFVTGKYWPFIFEITFQPDVA